MDKYKFGEYLYKKRKSLGLTQDELGQKLGVTNKAVSKWEVGETFPDITLLNSLSKILGITTDELLTQKEVKREPNKKSKVNIILLIFLILLVVLQVITVTSFSGILIGKYIVENGKNNEIIELHSENYKNYIQIDAMDYFISNGDELIIESSCNLDSNYRIVNEITMRVAFEINAYYYLSDDVVTGISYYNREIEFILTEDTISGKTTIKLSPNSEINNLVGLKIISIEHKVISCNGSISKINNN